MPLYGSLVWLFYIAAPPGLEQCMGFNPFTDIAAPPGLFFSLH